MISGAYQALSIGIFYLLILLFIYYILFNLLSERKINEAINLIKLNLLFVIIILVLCLPLLISTSEVMSSVKRLNSGIELQRTLSFGQPITSFISFITPFSTLKNPEYYGNIDISLINHYFGIIPLIFFISSLFRKHTIKEYLILGFGLLIFLMSS
ncbi:MAG: hypothetical protein HC906_08965 [Bacteroidales bacterium]|nr:hypothetical protein [Bacteroidales bacterium]